jgi:hypothetical protein
VDSGADDFHPWSFPVSSIGQFWSHSWHDSAILKVMVLLLEYNFLAATVVGTLAACVAAALFATEVLPGMTVRRGHFDDKEHMHGVWCLSIGVLFFVLTLLCWRSDQSVFLDKVCISQANETKKMEGILGIGAFLKSSRSLLVLVDSTYVTRLWCVFELAAYCKLMKKDRDKTLNFIPLPFGNMFLCAFVVSTIVTANDDLMNATRTNFWVPVLVSLPTLSLFFHALRSHYDDLSVLRGQLADFTMGDAECYCCTVGHVDQDTGARLPCDRELVNACVDSWFGSSEAFNTFVHRNLSDKFAQSNGGVRMPFVLYASMCWPVIWAHMDLISLEFRESQWKGASRGFGRMAAELVIELPLWSVCICGMAYMTRRRLSSRFADMIVSVTFALVDLGILQAALIFDTRVFIALKWPLIRCFCFIMVIPTCFVCVLLVRFRLSGVGTHGSVLAKQWSIYSGVDANVRSGAAVTVVGNGIHDLEEAEWEDFTLDI